MSVTKTRDTAEDERRRLQEYIFGLEEAQDKADELSNEHEKLQHSQNLLMAVLDGTIHGILLIRDRTFVWSNKAFSDILGWGADELAGQSTEIIFPSREEYLRMGDFIYPDLPRKGMISYEYDYVHKNGHKVACMVTGRPLDEDDFSKGMVFSITDYTDRKRAEESSLFEKKRFKALAENSPFGLVMIGADGTFEYVNPKFKELFGYDLDEIPDGREWFRNAYPDRLYRRQVVAAWIDDRKSAEPGEQRPRIFSVRCKNGTTRIVHFKPVQLSTGQHLMTCEDITDRTESEERLKANVREKEVLLREIHHRVKNNLQLMGSMLALQSTYRKKGSVADVLKDAERRIWSMALVHETLYRSEDLGRRVGSEYFERLLEDFQAGQGGLAWNIRLEKDIEGVSISLDSAMNCGLIINELISNCLQHAFPDGREGVVKLSMRLIGRDEIELAVKDNGVGMPVDHESGNTKSFGLDLVDMLVDELKGNIQIGRDGGTEFRITFKREEKASRGPKDGEAL